MHFEGMFDTKSEPKELFGTLLDPKQLSGCMPGLQKLDVKSSDEFTVVVRAGISFIRGDFTIRFNIAERREPAHAKLTGRGTGMGSALEIEAVMDIAPKEKGSSMKWAADARVAGMIASLGLWLLEGQAEKTIREMFDCVRKRFERP